MSGNGKKVEGRRASEVRTRRGFCSREFFSFFFGKGKNCADSYGWLSKNVKLV